MTRCNFFLLLMKILKICCVFLIDRKPQLVSLLSKFVCLFLHVMLCMACLTCISIRYFWPGFLKDICWMCNYKNCTFDKTYCSIQCQKKIEKAKNVQTNKSTQPRWFSNEFWALILRLQINYVRCPLGSGFYIFVGENNIMYTWIILSRFIIV